MTLSRCPGVSSSDGSQFKNGFVNQYPSDLRICAGGFEDRSSYAGIDLDEIELRATDPPEFILQLRHQACISELPWCYPFCDEVAPGGFRIKVAVIILSGRSPSLPPNSP
ncbi:hypothetical protein DOTSEDRAFT_35578 [Dothistroma septosporum NZE10]|uniref:Uncharacterized protein n=1 Tax=Dothistroma septosporum (strain NZE10 / CBS 128990) TaxID=675120 RepID=M2YMW4_DOTSN|nr:hypothetical protein DOTSEDRAFT_35578 [Dothistroma septosporum NZE10]